MGIYIKGMKIPRCCGKCPIHYTSDLLGGYEVCGATDTIFNDGTPFCHSPEIDMSTEKLDNCPLIEIPPHGLIDKQMLLRNIADNQFALSSVGHEEDYAFWDKVWDYINDAPTVIEAEGE